MFRDRRAVVLDLEGVLYAGGEVLPGAKEFLAALDGRGIPHRFITNISRHTAADVRAHMAILGIDPGPGRIVGALDWAGEFLRRRYGAGRVLVLGVETLQAAIRAAGFEVVPPWAEGRADIVLVGLDEGLTHFSLSAAARAVCRGAHFVALNPDVRAPREGGSFELGGGAVALAVQAAAGRAPVVIGKPGPFLFEQAMAELGVRAAEAVMVGDNLRTDVAGARAAGMASVWVNRWGALPGDPDVKPDMEVRRVDEILPHLPGGARG
ncbi:MAG: HAD-IIA family hydrolase [Candidatus Tectomicrobia bacterium]|nr:HAD-IIA family hydrolase [Candidatus Tectomicrobia bacterium]